MSATISWPDWRTLTAAIAPWARRSRSIPNRKRCWKNACRSLKDETDELKTDGARELAVKRQTAEETIARFQTASGALEVQVAATRAELSAYPSRSDGAVATLHSDLTAAHQALAAAIANSEASNTSRRRIARSARSSALRSPMLRASARS